MARSGKSVSVIVPSYKGASRLPALFGALAAQDVARDWELVLVLDGTPDDSRVVAGDQRGRLPLLLVELAENRGRSGALNAGFEAASGEILVRCDDDLVPPPHFVEEHGLHHDAGGPVGIIGAYRNVFPPNRYAAVYGLEADRRHWAEAMRRPPEMRWIHWAGNCSVSQEVWSQVGPYDPRFVGWGWEDIDWGFRLHKLGVPIVFDPQLAAEHRHAVLTCTTRIDRAFQGGLARRTFVVIHGVLDPQLPDTWWSRFTSAAGRLSASWHHRVGRLLDIAIHLLPCGFGRRLVAFAVEAAALAGYRAAQRVSTTKTGEAGTTL